MTGDTVHASAVKVGASGILIRGVAGSGKSSLVLQLLSADPATTNLIADDQVALSAEDGRLMAAAPQVLAGLIEIRGQGILRVPYISPAAIDLVVDLASPADCPRLPTFEQRSLTLLGLTLARIFVAAGAGDGAARVRAAMMWPALKIA